MTTPIFRHKSHGGTSEDRTQSWLVPVPGWLAAVRNQRAKDYSTPPSAPGARFVWEGCTQVFQSTELRQKTKNTVTTMHRGGKDPERSVRQNQPPTATPRYMIVRGDVNEVHNTTLPHGLVQPRRKQIFKERKMTGNRRNIKPQESRTERNC